MAQATTDRRRHTPVTTLLVLSAIVALSLASPLAGEAHAEDKTAARDHWERGTKFYDLGKYDEAIREFEAAYEAKGDPAFLYNLAQSHRLAGHPTESLRFYRTYLRYVPKAANRADIEVRIKELEKVVADRPGDTSGTSPPPAGTAPQGGIGSTPPATAPPATGTGFPPPQSPPPPGAGWPGTGTSPPPAPTGGPEGQIPPAGAPGTGFPTNPPADGPVPGQRSRRKTLAYVLAGAGGGLIVLGGIFGLVAKSQSDKVETAARNGERFDPSVESLGTSSEGLQWIGYGLGAAAVITGVILYATAPRESETASAPTVAVAPVAGPGIGGALLRVSF